jgi:hypothetical protein
VGKKASGKYRAKLHSRSLVQPVSIFYESYRVRFESFMFLHFDTPRENSPRVFVKAGAITLFFIGF